MFQEIIDWILYSIIKLNANSRLAQSLNFFVYDSIKIIVLLFVMVFLIGILRTYIPNNKVRKWLSNRKKGVGNFFAALLGAITPFCSCSSIPMFFSFLKAGVPLGITFSFLITSPMINEYLVVLMLAFFGWKITLGYVISGIIIGVVAGLILGELKLEKYIEKDLFNNGKIKEKKYNKFKERIVYGLNEAASIVKKFWLWVLIGVGIGALAHNYIPQEFVQSVISKGGIFTVPIATLIGVPLYAGCAAILPIAVVLFQKGIPLGTALSFMMSTSALSLPEAIILKRAMKLKLIIIFFGIVTAGIILTGYLFNLLQGLFS